MQVKDRSLFSLSWPLILTFGVGMFQPIMDSWFLSRTSEVAAAGVGAVLPILGALFMAIQAFSQAGASIASQYLGGNYSRHARVTQTMIIIGSFLLGISMTLLILPLSSSISKWIGLEATPAAYAEEFLFVTAFGFAFRALQTTYTALIATHGLTIWNLIGNIITIASNAFLNVVFLEGWFGLPQLGVHGVALATAISWLISALFLGYILKKKLHHNTKKSDFKRVRVILPDWIRIGLPAAAEPFSFQLFQIFITAMVVSLGTIAMTSRIFSANLAALAVILSVGLGSGNQILVAHLVGAHDYNKANRRLHQSLIISCISSFLIALSVALFGAHLMTFFTDNPEVIRIGAACLWCDVVLQPFKAANIVITSSLRAAGDSSFPAIVGSGMMWTLGVGSALFLAFVLDLGIIGLWLGMACDEFYRSIVNYIRWRKGRWKTLGVM